MSSGPSFSSRKPFPAFKVLLLLILPVNLPILFSSCGYTDKTTLPQNMKTIYVDTVQNAIPIDSTYAYHPGLEMDITNAIIRRLHRDGNLKVVPKDQADVELRSKLTGFQQEGLRFDSLETVEEFRLFVVLHLQLVNAKSGEIIWEEPNFSGDGEYFVSEVRSLSRGEAAQRVIERLAKNVVDRIVEDW